MKPEDIMEAATAAQPLDIRAVIEQLDGRAGQAEGVSQAMREAVERLRRELPPAEARLAVMRQLIAFKDQLLAYVNAVTSPDAAAGMVAQAASGGALGGMNAIALAQRRGQTVSAAMANWVSLVKVFRYRERQRIARRNYADADCGLAPFRDADHGALRLLCADEASLPLADGSRRAMADVEPFVAACSQRARAAAQQRWMLARRLTEADLKGPHEASLVGQRGVFARANIPAGTCLGVYGGQMLGEVDYFLLQDDRYLMALRSGAGPAFVNGENLMSLTNTLFEVDAMGQRAGHPAEGYNLTRVLFPSKWSHGWHIGLPAFFASQDIPAGTELRWNYDLSRA
ncbi:SET domain-containing protein [Roseateles sp. SL47]|uniref:SET domain-containing protein n=1 Tax=Roseateles sp. SL47 TaxID=2995138 RepID=UPI0022718E65|nr:SET domain-containing protein [Roseateles sp. SL47]WAC71579.1 SET domain-containing protein [Roseateles sp. SL47]